MPYPSFESDFPIALATPENLRALSNEALQNLVYQGQNEQANIELILRSEFGGRKKTQISQKLAVQIAENYLQTYDANHFLFNYVLGLNCYEKDKEKSRAYFKKAFLNDKQQIVFNRVVSLICDSYIKAEKDPQWALKRCAWLTLAVKHDIGTRLFLSDNILSVKSTGGDEKPELAGVALSSCILLALEFSGVKLKGFANSPRANNLGAAVSGVIYFPPDQPYAVDRSFLIKQLLLSYPKTVFTFFNYCYEEKIISQNVYIQVLNLLASNRHIYAEKHPEISDKVNYNLYLFYLHNTNSIDDSAVRERLSQLTVSFTGFKVSDLKMTDPDLRDQASMATFNFLYRNGHHARALYFLNNIQSCKHYDKTSLLKFLRDDQLLTDFEALNFKRDILKKICRAHNEVDPEIFAEAFQQLAALQNPMVILKFGLEKILAVLNVYWNERKLLVAKHPFRYNVDEFFRHQGEKREEFIKLLTSFKNNPLLTAPLSSPTAIKECRELLELITTIIDSGKTNFKGPHVEPSFEAITSLLKNTTETFNTVSSEALRHRDAQIESSQAPSHTKTEPQREPLYKRFNIATTPPSAPALSETSLYPQLILDPNTQASLYPQLIVDPNTQQVEFKIPTLRPEVLQLQKDMAKPSEERIFKFCEEELAAETKQKDELHEDLKDILIQPPEETKALSEPIATVEKHEASELNQDTSSSLSLIEMYTQTCAEQLEDPTPIMSQVIDEKEFPRVPEDDPTILRSPSQTAAHASFFSEKTPVKEAPPPSKSLTSCRP